ncbi:MAG: hypothetical protein OMM_11921 [Candidatus Magnetoglobus multicellularis str. Araruama]|uniref:Uncharacterized protein n=1 Tax=Candidatus Magnetoglobus multicellularis str. Araruama TaxID=890399 RepID=A0A1V1NX37_9BACT|nr:MAG: hypothetical protein OMM_11921 [Candidatus Magnetoglobus multicellularis str. Araruama]
MLNIFLKKGLHEAKSDGSPELKGLAFLYLGNLYAVKGLYHEAITEYQNCYHACELATKSSLMKTIKNKRRNQYYSCQNISKRIC